MHNSSSRSQQPAAAAACFENSSRAWPGTQCAQRVHQCGTGISASKMHPSTSSVEERNARNLSVTHRPAPAIPVLRVTAGATRLGWQMHPTQTCGVNCISCKKNLQSWRDYSRAFRFLPFFLWRVVWGLILARRAHFLPDARRNFCAQSRSIRVYAQSRPAVQ
jgi:hypothetical protein